MLTSSKLLKLVLQPRIWRFMSSFKTELTVPTFSDIQIKIPYKVEIKPLNVHKYHNCDKLLIELIGTDENVLGTSIDGNKIKIYDQLNRRNVDEEILCKIKAPVKSNLDIESLSDIKVGHFQGNKVIVNSTDGDVTINKFQGDCLEIQTRNGDINLKDYILASTISAVVLNSGNISAGRLQGSHLELKTRRGNVAVQSSYCFSSSIETLRGNVNLNNIHKYCEIYICEGDLLIDGFDGKLFTIIDNGSADMTLSRITGDSEIIIKEYGCLNLKLSDDCQESVCYKIKSKDCEVDKNIKLKPALEENSIVLKSNGEHNMMVDCEHCSVSVSPSSWRESLALKFQK